MKMRKMFGLFLGVFILCSTMAYAFESKEWAQYSAAKSDDALILTGAGFIYEIWVTTDASNAVTLTICDGLTSAGTPIAPVTVIPTSATDRSRIISFPYPVGVNSGIYIDVLCTGTVGYTVYYRKK